MTFYDFVLDENSDDYTKGVVLRANGSYIGNLSPLGVTRRYSYDRLEIGGSHIFVSGFGNYDTHCYHNYRVDMPQKGESYSFNALAREKEIVPKYNAVEFICYDELGIAGARLYAYDETLNLTNNYHWLKDKPQFYCGDVKIVFAEDNSVRFYKKGSLLEEVHLLEEDKQVFGMMYSKDSGQVYVEAFDVKDIERKCRPFYFEKEW